MGTRNFVSERGIPQLIHDLENLLIDTKSADTTFYVGPNEVPIPCHSIILKCRCKLMQNEEQKRRFPSMNPELFERFLQYLYTGKLSVDENSVFDLFCIASEFGMEDLEATCEDLLCTHLEPSLACSLLSSALKFKEKVQKSGKGLQKFIDRCILFIGENPGDCINTTTFLSLPMQSLEVIISSDQLCLEEEEVWRCVLRWSQFQAGVDTHVTRWSEEERVKVAKYLSPIISHVRLLLIDSRVFAEEIEPTGCVPMALSLERYRFAALPHQFGERDSRLVPRNSPRLFQASSIIQTDRIALGRKLNEWYGGSSKQSWRCIYRASKHGYSANDFHSRCDGKAPTYVIVLIKNTKWICGGFSDVPWSRSKTPKYVMSKKSFLFCYDGNSSDSSRPQPIKFNVVKKHFALCHDSNSGPIFGAGADLCITSNCNSNSDSYSNLPHSYESDEGGIESEGSVLTPSYNFTVADYEVFVPALSSSPDE